MADFNYSLSEAQITQIESMEKQWSLVEQSRRMTPIALGHVTLDTAGGAQAITDTNLNAGDVALVTLTKDDTGTSITNIIAVVSANTLTITRTDDGSSADDGECNYIVFRP